ncbi:MAG: hypothetical protein HY553_22670 [Elusimicrobia bacterium]|nr:hypothetical protein [Elusimicrobiota bacterium]
MKVWIVLAWLASAGAAQDAVDERPVRVEAVLTHRALPAEYDTDFRRLGTQNGWAPGAPRLVSNKHGAFAVVLRPESPRRNELRFDLLWRSPGGAAWRAILRDQGPALSDPILVTDRRNRLHLLYPSTRACAPGGGSGNIVHRVVTRKWFRWRVKAVPTAKILGDAAADCSGYPRTQRYGAAVHDPERALYLVFTDLAGRDHRIGFASLNLRKLAWSPMIPVPETGTAADGAGYSYVAPGAGRELSFVATNFLDENYYRVSWFRSPDRGATWSATALCESRGEGGHDCLSGDILSDERGRTYAMLLIDVQAGARTPFENADDFPERRAAYLVSSHEPSVASPIVDREDPSGPSPDWRAALGEWGPFLIVLGPTESGAVGLWVSEDSGVSWRYADLTSQFPKGSLPYQFRFDKRQYGSRVSKRPFGLFTDTSNPAAIKTYEFELRELKLVR